MKHILIISITLACVGCSSLRQFELESALSAAQNIVESPETIDAIDGLLLEAPNARWACRALDVGNLILKQFSGDFRGRETVQRLVTLAAQLCPGLIDMSCVIPKTPSQ